MEYEIGRGGIGMEGVNDQCEKKRLMHPMMLDAAKTRS